MGADEKGGLVIRALHGGKLSLQHGDLLRAAPDLLAALQLALSHVPKNTMVYSEGNHGDRVYVLDVIRAAIAKATR